MFGRKFRLSANFGILDRLDDIRKMEAMIIHDDM